MQTYMVSISLDKQAFRAQNLNYFLIHHLRHVFWVLKNRLTEAQNYAKPSFCQNIFDQKMFSAIYLVAYVHAYLNALQTNFAYIDANTPKRK